jgi:Concanavalin A-like lectin/glucanases superfamily
MQNFSRAENSLFATLFSQHEFKPFQPGVLAAACALVAALTALPAHAQTCAPPPAGLVSWWPLDETTGTVVADVLNNNPGTASGPIGSGGIKSFPGEVGNGLNFFFQGRVAVGNNPSLDFGTSKSFTIDAWIKGSASPIVSNYDLATKTGYSLVYDGTKLRFEMGGSTPSTTWYGPAIIPNTWTFVAVVVDRTSPTKTVTLYTSADMSGTPAVPPIPATADAGTNLPFYIGGCPGNPNGCNTVLDEVEIFNRALTRQELESIHTVGSAGKCKQTAGTKGMTWLHSASNAQTGTITVGCAGCDAYQGDTVCSQQLPLLCIYKPTPAFPLPAGVNNSNQYSLWSGGVVATTAPVAGNTFAHSTDATNYCVAQFGPTWRVAEFHDGAGWNFQAYGGTVSAPTVPSTRFWAHINDQPAANCWQTP